MRIPQGSDFFGQRIPQVYPTDDAASLRDMELSKGKIDTGVYLAAKETEKIGNTLMDIGINDKLHEEKIKLIEEAKINQKLEIAKKEKEHSELQTKIISYKSAVKTAASNIFNNKDIPDDQKLTEFEKIAGEIKSKVAADFGDKGHVIPPLHAEAMAEAKASLQNMQVKKLNDESRASGIELLNYLEQEAAKSPEDRFKAIAILEKGAEFNGYSEQEKTKLKLEFREKTADNEIINRLNSKDYEGTLKDLKAKDSEGNPTYLTDLDPKNREHFIGSIQNAIEHEKKQQAAAKKAAYREWKADIRDLLNDYKETKLSGLPPDLIGETQLYKAVKGTEFESKFIAIKKKGESFAHITEQLAKDPLTFGAARMGIQIEPLNLTDPARLAQQYQGRIEIGKKVRASNNLTYTPVLTTDEVKGLSDMLKKQQTGSVQTIAQFTKVIGKDGMLDIAQQIAAEDTQTGMMIGYVADGKTGIAQSIAEGHKYITDKTVKFPKEDEFQGQFTRLLKDSFKELPETQNAYYEMFKSYYVSTAARKGITDGSYDTNTGKEALKAVVGEVTKFNGKRVVIPEGYDESKFKNFMKSISGDSIASAGGAAGLSNDAAAGLIKDDAQLYATSNPAVFRVVVDGKYLVRADKKGYFTLTFQPDWTPSGVIIKGIGDMEDIHEWAEQNP